MQSPVLPLPSFPGISASHRGLTSRNPSYQPRDDVYGAYDGSYMNTNGPNQATQAPIVTGTSVIAIKFSEGVVIAADNLGTSLSLLALHCRPVLSLYCSKHES